MKRYLCLILLSFTTYLFANETNEQAIQTLVSDGAVPSLVNLTALPTSIVNGSVNVISGDFCEVEEDDTVSGGPDPYILGHSYFSSSLDEGNLGDGWNFAHAHRLEVFTKARIDRIVKKDLADAGSDFYYLMSLEEYQALHPEAPSPAEDTPFIQTDPEDIEEDNLFPEDDFEEDMQEDGEVEEDEGAIFANEEMLYPILYPILSPSQLVIKDVHDKTRDRRGYQDYGTNGQQIHQQQHHHHEDKGDPDGKPLYLSLYDPNGGRLLFKTTYEKREKERSFRHFKLVTKKTGFTNISGGEISGKTNIKNISLKWRSGEDIFYVTFGDGTVKEYERQPITKKDKKDTLHYTHYRDYQLHKEIKPNGNIVIYHYNNRHEITDITTYNRRLTHKLNEITFEQKSLGAFAKRPTLHVKTSDDQEHVYYFKKLKGSKKQGIYAVSGIKRPGKPYQKFKYTKRSSHHKRRVRKKKSEDGSYIETKYYHAGVNKVGNEKIGVKGKKARRLLQNRVRSQYGPLGPNGARIRTHMYRYFKDSNGGGHAKVYDAENSITRYFWNKHNRLIYIKKSDSRDRVLMREKYIWGKTGSCHEGRLCTRILLDEHDHPILSRHYRYDSQGNVFEEHVYGRIRKNEGYLHIKDNKPHKYTCDECVYSYSYSDDGFNLKTKEKDTLGNETRYEYMKGTNLMKAKYICEGKTIRRREFFAYDDNAIMVEHTVDDGSHEDRHNLKGVTERHITCIKPRAERPHFGEPEVIEEYYYDFDKNKEVLLNKTVKEFSKKGFVKKKKVYDQEGGHVSFEYLYDDIGRILYSRDPEGREEHFTYDVNGRLEQKRGPRDDVSRIYSYDVLDRLVKETEKHVSGLELSTTYCYDALNRKIAVTDPQGNTTRYAYDALNRITKITYPPTYDHEGNKITSKKSYTYEKLGTKVTEIDENQHITVTYYSILGKVLRRELPDGTCYEYEYDLKGNLVLEKAPNDTITKMQYDALNQLIQSKIVHKGKSLSKQKYTYNSFHLLRIEGPTNEKTTYSYDFAGRRVEETKQATRKAKRKTTFQYDAQNRLVKEHQLLGNNSYICKKFAYDDLGRCVLEKMHDNEHEACTFKAYSYDQEGNLASITQQIDGQTAIATTSYCPHGLPKVVSDAMGNDTRYLYHYFYKNRYGQSVLARDTIDARGCIDKEIFDTHRNLSAVTRLDPSGTLIAKKELFYDAQNNLIRIHEYAKYGMNDGHVDKKIVTLLTYGPLNRLESITEAAGTAEQKITTYSFNAHGQKETITYNDGTRLHHTYDYKGRLKRYYSNDNTVDYSYTYDASNRLLSAKNNLDNTATLRTYNDFGEIISETLDTGLTLHYDYDNAGRMLCLTLPDSSKIAYSYSPAFLSSIKRQDAQNRTLYEHKIIARDLSGHIQKAELAAQCGTITYDYDLLGRRTCMNHPAFTQKTTQFDPMGNLLGLYTSDPIGETERTFSYDFLSELTQETGPTTHTYSYDSLYNRRTLDEKVYTVNSLHEVLSDERGTYTYDARGNRLTMTVDNKTTRYFYDALDRLISLETSDGKCYRYSYDAFNRRTKKISTEEIKYLYALDNEIGAIDSQGTITELRLLGEGQGAEIGASIALELNQTLYIPLHDCQGNISAILNSTGEPVTTYRYDAFGNDTAYGEIQSPWRFASKRQDPESGLLYFGRRYYDPTIGKWLTQDPLGLKAGPNLYAYVLNNPLTRLDLYGLLDENSNDRSFAGRIGDAISSGFRAIRDFTCKALEKVVHHMPHIGRLNDHIEDTLRSFRGESPKVRMKSGVYLVKKGTPTKSGCEAFGVANGIACDFDGLKGNIETLAKKIGDNCPDMYAFYSETHGFSSDLLRALANIIGAPTSNVEPIAEGMAMLSDRCQKNGTFWVAVPHSLGGRTMYLAKTHVDARYLQSIKVESIGSAILFNDLMGFSSTANHCGWTDLVSPLADPVRYIFNGVFGKESTFVGSPFALPLSRHAFQGKDYDNVLQTIADKYK